MSVDVIHNYSSIVNSRELHLQEIDEIDVLLMKVFHGIPWDPLLKKKEKNDPQRYSAIVKRAGKIDGCFFKSVWKEPLFSRRRLYSKKTIQLVLNKSSIND
jgi:hypothetical protein